MSSASPLRRVGLALAVLVGVSSLATHTPTVAGAEPQHAPSRSASPAASTGILRQVEVDEAASPAAPLDELDLDEDLVVTVEPDVHDDHAPHSEPVATAVPLSDPAQTSALGDEAITSSQLAVCDDGTSGPRIQVLYMPLSNGQDRFQATLPTMRTSIAFADAAVNDSSPGREMHLRLVHGSSCQLQVTRIVPPASVVTLNGALSYLAGRADLQRPDRKYLAFVDDTPSSTTCGLGTHYADESPGGGNLNNGIRPTHAVVGTACWDVPYNKTNPWAIGSVHEIFHMLGAVNRSAPNYANNGHCTDEYDLMCYGDGLTYDNGCGVNQPGQLTDPHNFLLDCNDDDYYSPTRPTGGYLAANWNTAESDFLYGNEGDHFTALADPQRAYDSRVSGRPLTSSGIWIPLSISPNNPAVNDEATIPWDATSVVLNVTMVNATEPTFVAVWPSGLPQPLGSSLNIVPGPAIANQVTVKLGSGGSTYGSGAIALAVNTGRADVVVDVVGYYRKVRPQQADSYVPVTPYRLVSSRDGIGPYSSPWGPRQTRTVKVAGTGGSRGVPANATAVVMNVTGLRATTYTYFSVTPHRNVHEVSSLNLKAGKAVPNQVTVGLVNGRIDVYHNAGTTDVILDIVGYYVPGTQLAAGTGTFVPVPNQRILDSRPDHRIGPLTTWGPRTTRTLKIGGTGVIPSDAKGVVLNVTGVRQTRDTYISLYPADAPTRPIVSNLNLPGGGTARPNAVTVGLDSSGRVKIYNNAGRADVVIDLVGYFR